MNRLNFLIILYKSIIIFKRLFSIDLGHVHTDLEKSKKNLN